MFNEKQKKSTKNWKTVVWKNKASTRLIYKLKTITHLSMY